MEMWIPFISEFGFPIMVTLYLLHRLEKKLDHVAVTIEQLPTKLVALNHPTTIAPRK